MKAHPLKTRALHTALNNLPSEAFLLLGTSALHGDGWLSLDTLDERLRLLREKRKEKKKTSVKTQVLMIKLTFNYSVIQDVSIAEFHGSCVETLVV